MPPRTRPRNQNPAPDWKPTQSVPDPILNGPYSEPNAHWIYRDGIPQRAAGRRPAGYYFTSKAVAQGQRDLLAEEQFDPIELVNRLRQDVKRWRDAEYRGATSITRELLQYWTAERARPMFFCQLEAVETLIYLLEIAIPGRLNRTGYQKFEVDEALLKTLLKGERPPFAAEDNPNWPRLIDRPLNPDELGLRRLGCKMATGSGKTTVMAMLITWAFLNRARNPNSTQFPNAVLVCAPNLTVKERLQVLYPSNASNVYDQFTLVPGKYRELMNVGKVLVTNWHNLALKSENREGDASYRVVQKGEETADAFTIDRLGELASRLPILVLNDEGHHCWRPNPAGSLTKAQLAAIPAEERKRLEEDQEEARVWLAGLDRINNCGLLGKDVHGKPLPGVLACVDLSATPFYLSNSGYLEGSPFPWLVSDFGLVDAIECGIVKIPRLPVGDNQGRVDDAGRPDPKYFRLWHNITENLNPVDRIGNRPKPDAIYREAESALKTLASQWLVEFRSREKEAQGGHFIPPVLIVVCDNTDIADLFYQKLSGEHVEDREDAGGVMVEQTVYGDSEVLQEFRNEPGQPKRTFRIDSKLLAKLETSEGESKDEAAVALRELIATVGKHGQPGEQVRCVVSVSMLTEGWDANTVTHILGVRAFGSQLLCEQVVGRGLRRMNYTVNPETGKLPAEYVDVYGIPFSLIPFKGQDPEKPTPTPHYRHIYSVEERASFELRFPLVQSYTYDVRDSGLECDISTLPEIVVNAEPVTVYLTPTRGYNDDANPMMSGDYVEQNRDAYYQTVRPQQVLFRIAMLIVDDLLSGATGPGADAAKAARTKGLARHQIFPEVLRILEQYVASGKIKFAPGLDVRELALEKYARQVRERVRDCITAAVATRENPLLPVLSRFKEHITTAGVDDHTTREVVELTKSHLNAAIVRSEDEKLAIAVLEDMDEVECFAPNSRRIGMVIPYRFDDASCNYEPDFVVRLVGGVNVVVEIKGVGGRIFGDDANRTEAKRAAAEKWVKALNNSGRYGKWAYVYCDPVSTLRELLRAHVPADAVKTLPFTVVQAAPDDYFDTCIPLTTFRSVAQHFEGGQLDLDSLVRAAHSWISWNGHPPFAEGMFVVRITGRAMEPQIPDGIYALFGPPAAGDRNGRRLLVYHNAIRGREPLTGGPYTFRLYQSEKAIAGDEGFKHTKVTLRASNPDFEPIVFTATDEAHVLVLGEWLGNIPAAVSGEVQ
ncbi:MAG: DEAD/DEAH box helicase family protein [Vicinamibacterales bacterium]